MPLQSASLCVTGASGWIGGALMREAARRGRAAIGVPLRRGAAPLATAAGPGSVVVHLAAIAHRGSGTVSDAEYDRVDRALAVEAAHAAAAAGARRFVFVSSAAVMGPASARPWRESDPVDPVDAYARAKAAAEAELLGMHAPGRFEVVVARPPLVWGPGARANFAALVRAADSGWPLPLARATAPRSMVHLDDLTDALLHLAGSPAASGRVFFVGDGRDRSVADWIRAIRAARGRPARLLALPPGLLRLALRAAGRGDAWTRLFEPAQIDPARLFSIGWRPRTRFDDALRALLPPRAGSAGAAAAGGDGAQPPRAP